MPTPQQTQIAPTRYALLATLITDFTPSYNDALAQATTPETDYNRAADAMIVEALMAISFGVINHADPHTALVADVGALYSDRLLGYNAPKQTWKKYERAVSRVLDKMPNDDENDITYLALSGAYYAAQDTDTSAEMTMWRAINLWEIKVPGQLAAATYWAVERLIHHTKGEKDNG